MKIAMIGDGNVGSALKRGLSRAGHEVRSAGKDRKAVQTAGAWGEAIFLAVPFAAVDDALESLGDAVSGKTMVDCTNPLGADFSLAIGFTTSAGEEVQKKAPKAKVVKAFNTVFAQWMDSGRLKGQPITTFIAGDDAKAKATVLQLANGIGFDPVDAGPLKNARWIESMAYLIINVAYVQKMGGEIGFKLIR